MASVTSLMSSSSSTSSIYGNRNVISGLASGMDTEAMIQNSIKGYQSKITSLQQKLTKTQWKQDAYRSLITQMNGVLSKYTSYTSSTNLFSSSFFSKAINTVANGANAGKVSASGRSSSNIVLNSVSKLAQAASYTVGTADLAAKGATTTEFDLGGEMTTSGVSGSITIRYGGGTNSDYSSISSKGSTFTLRFDEGEVFESAEDLAKAINQKLKDQSISSSNGATSADNYIEAKVDGNGRVSLYDKKGNSFGITRVSGDMEKLFKKSEANGQIIPSELIGNTEQEQKDFLQKKVTTEDYLKDKGLTLSVDGKSKNIKLDFLGSEEYKKLTTEADKKQYLVDKLNESIKEAFGKNSKIEASVGNAGNLTFSGIPEHSTFKIGGTDMVNKALGLGEGGYSNTVQTGWTLERVLGKDAFTKTETVDGKNVQYAELEINGKTIKLNSTDTISDMMSKINESDAGVEVKYSSLTGRFAFTSKETGADSAITIGSKNAELKKLFGFVDKDGAVDGPYAGANAQYTKGQNAEFNVTVNGESMTLTRSSNTVNLDGMELTFKDTFTDGEPVTFTTSSDSDKIVDAIKSFVNDYNEMVTALHNSYSTMPLKTSSGKSYEPLTDDDRNSMSESAVKTHEENAKTGLLFGDMDLANVYSKLTEVVQGGSNGANGAALRAIGLNVGYSNGLSTIELDEEALRKALDTDPDKVKNAFAGTNGLMSGMKDTLEQYANTSIANPGILVNKAGTALSSYSLSHNELNDQIESLNDQIEKWQEKMSDRVDYYTSQFTRLEQLISQMNSQSSMLSGLTGGY